MVREGFFAILWNVAKKKNASTNTSTPEWENDLQAFFQSPIAQRAGALLSHNATVVIHIDGTNFLFSRRNGSNVLERVEEPQGDVHFWVPLITLRHLLSLVNLPDTGIGTMGVAVLEALFQSNDEKKIRFRVNSGFLGLWAKGYFSVLKEGGPEVASYLARLGFDSVARIKEVLSRIRG